MKKVFFLCLFSVAYVAAVEPAKEPVIKQPVDQTDIFAIPLDEDEQSQDEELQEFTHPKK